MGRRGVGFWAVLLVLLPAAIAARADDTFYITGREWRGWDPAQKAFYLKGFVEGYHSTGANFTGNSSIRTIGDLRARVDAFYDRFPEAAGVEVEAVITTLLTSVMDLGELGQVLTRRNAVKEETLPSGGTKPAESPPVQSPVHP